MKFMSKLFGGKTATGKGRLSVKTSAALAAMAVAVVGGYEGLKLTAYRDTGGVPTICYGETFGVYMGQKKTLAECDAMLVESLAKHEDGMLKCTKVDLPPKRHVALLSFTYNVGIGAYCSSTLVKKLNAGDTLGACKQLMRWNKDNGKVIRGLTIRRADEYKLCVAEL